jgi:hypothetical protein
MTYVVKLSLPGYDVRTATPEQCAIHSSYPPLKSKLGQSPKHSATLNVDFTGPITQDLTQTIYSFPHGYDYIPLSLSNMTLTIMSVSMTGIGFVGTGSSLAVNAYCTSSHFIVSVYDNAFWIDDSTSLQVSYDIFAENGT